MQHFESDQYATTVQLKSRQPLNTELAQEFEQSKHFLLESKCDDGKFHDCGENQLCILDRYSLAAKCVDFILPSTERSYFYQLGFKSNIAYCDEIDFSNKPLLFNGQCLVLLDVPFIWRRNEDRIDALCSKRLNPSWRSVSAAHNEVKKVLIREFIKKEPGLTTGKKFPAKQWGGLLCETGKKELWQLSGLISISHE